MLDFLREFLATTPTITIIFMILISVLALGFHVRYGEKSISVGPTILTTVGIFGTFLGIAIGLFDFNTDNVQDSIPALLNGLKTAFFGSVVGVFFALTLKIRELGARAGATVQPPGISGDAKLADLVVQLRDIRVALTGDGEGSLSSQIKLAQQDTNDRLAPLKAIQDGLLGSEEGSLLAQVRLLRQDSKDGFARMDVALREAIAMLSEMGTKAIIEALRDVIRDFNLKITEQFGDNFRQLNEAVGRLLVWQEQYRHTVEMAVGQLERVGNVAGVMTENFSVVVERSTRFSDAAERLSAVLATLSDLLRTLRVNEARLAEQSAALADLLLKASGSLPEVERRIEELARQMAAAVLEHQRTVGAAITTSTSAIEGTVTAVGGRLDKSAKTLATSVKDNQKAVSDSLKQTTDMLLSSIKQAQDDITKTHAAFTATLNESGVKTREHVDNLHKALEEALEASLVSLVGQLTTLSRRFADDYTPLADKLQLMLQALPGGRT